MNRVVTPTDEHLWRQAVDGEPDAFGQSYERHARAVYGGKRPGKKGRYTIAVADQSSTNGFLLQKTNHAALRVSGTTFVGKSKALVTLTVGKWLLMPQPGKTTFVIVVS
jgi:hypothetical protein